MTLSQLPDIDKKLRNMRQWSLPHLSCIVETLLKRKKIFVKLVHGFEVNTKIAKTLIFIDGLSPTIFKSKKQITKTNIYVQSVSFVILVY